MTEEAAHSSLGPSSWDRWVRCPGSVKAADGVPDPSGYAAAEGTVFHAMAAAALQTGVDPEMYLGWEPEGEIELEEQIEPGVIQTRKVRIPVDRDMVDAAEHGLQRIRSLIALPGAMWFAEKRVDISEWTEIGQFGTADVIILFPADKKIMIIDWKYGYIPVDPYDSFQVRGYALGVWNEFKHLFDHSPEKETVVEMVIEQPRLDATFKRHVITVADLLDFGQYVKTRVDLTRADNLEFNPSVKACQWCPIRDACGARAQMFLKMMDMEDAKDPPVFPTFDDDQRAVVVKHSLAIKRWVDEVYAKALADALVGRHVPGMRLALGRNPPRRYMAGAEKLVEQLLVHHLGSGAYRPQQILTPAQAEKRLGKEDYGVSIAPLVDRGKPGHVLVAEESGAPRIDPPKQLTAQDWT